MINLLLARCLWRDGQPYSLHRHQGPAEEGPDDRQDAPLRPGQEGETQGADPGRARGVRVPVQRPRHQAVRGDIQ